MPNTDPSGFREQLAEAETQLDEARAIIQDLVTVIKEHPGWQGYPRTWGLVNSPQVKRWLEKMI